MIVAIIGSEELDFDLLALYRYACNVIYPHYLDTIATTNEDGVAASAREMGDERGVRIEIVDTWREAVDYAQSTIILRKADEYPYMARYCNERGKPFKEYVAG